MLHGIRPHVSLGGHWGHTLPVDGRLSNVCAYAILWLMGLWTQRLVRLLVALAVAVGALYLGDWAVLRSRIAHGTAYSVVQVNQFLATPLKGNKVEYDFMGTAPQTCSRSIFPQQGNVACWWLERHTSQWE